MRDNVPLWWATGDPDVLQLRGVKFLPSGDNAGAGGLVVVARGTARYPKPRWVSS